MDQFTFMLFPVLKNEPDNFYHKVRPYMTGWENSKFHPDGLFYEGASDNISLDDSYKKGSLPPKAEGGSYRKYAGGSAGQSPLIHCLDIALGVEHFPTGVKKEDGKSSKPSYIYHMRTYMFKSHRQFIERIAECPSIRDYVMLCKLKIETNTTTTTDVQRDLYVRMIAAFNQAVDNMKAFRDKHFQMVTRYIILPATRTRDAAFIAKEDVPPARGTGGTGNTSML